MTYKVMRGVGVKALGFQSEGHTRRRLINSTLG